MPTNDKSEDEVKRRPSGVGVIPWRWQHANSGLAGDFQLRRVSEWSLEFHARFNTAPASTVNHEPGKFVEGLWESDVIELFLHTGPQEDRYVEINLGPTGAWWAVQLNGVRQREHLLPRCVEQVTTEKIESGWAVSARLRLDERLAESPIGNVTAISGTDSQRFASWVDLKSSKPDFHRPSEFASLPIS